MLFNSYEFIFLFLPITVLGFFIIFKAVSSLADKAKGKSAATLWLVITSLFFYGWWDYQYVPLLLGSITFNYLTGRKIESLRSKKWLIFGIAVNVILLGYYKYTGFFIENIDAIIGMNYDIPNIILPLGISFFTFTQTAYLVDAYRGETKNDSFLTYCEFVTIFPHLIAGPIINHREMIPQFSADKTFRVNWENVSMGITIFAMGLFKKVVIADKFAVWSSEMFSQIEQLNLVEAWCGILSYLIQLYFDFSAYSEMAIGLGLIINLKFPVNFNSPYQSTNMIDFWRRWHMTLGRWVKDYLYIPMGGNRAGDFYKMRNLFVSMAIIGFWHGAGWNYIIWGSLNGIYLVINNLWRKLNIRLPWLLCWVLTFGSFLISMVFFRTETLHDALEMLLTMFALGSIGSFSVSNEVWSILARDIGMVILLLKLDNPVVLLQKYKLNNIWLIITVIMFIYAVWHLNNYSEFLYFQF